MSEREGGPMLCRAHTTFSREGSDPVDCLPMNPPLGWGVLQILILNIFGINITPVQYSTNVYTCFSPRPHHSSSSLDLTPTVEQQLPPSLQGHTLSHGDMNSPSTGQPQCPPPPPQRSLSLGRQEGWRPMSWADKDSPTGLG